MISESSSIIQEQTSLTSTYSDMNQEDIPDLANFADKPDGILFDYLNAKIKQTKLFSDWAYRTIRNSNKKSVISEESSSENIPNEDECLKQFTKLKRIRRHKENCACVVQNAKYYIEKGKISQFFDKWRNATSNKLIAKDNSLSEIYSSSPTEIMGKIHAEIEKQANLETQLEAITSKTSDLEKMYAQTKKRTNKTKKDLENAQFENNRINDLYNTTCSKYEDEIATLKMNIPIVADKSKAILEKKKVQLKQRKIAEKIKSETDNETMESLRAKIKDIQEKLRKKKIAAVDARTACLAYKIKCDEISNLMMQDNEIHEKLSNDVSRMESQISSISINNLDELQKQKDDLDRDLINARSIIAQNEAIIQELDRKIQNLQTASKIYTIKLQSASHAFADDDVDGANSDDDYDM